MSTNQITYRLHVREKVGRGELPFRSDWLHLQHWPICLLQGIFGNLKICMLHRISSHEMDQWPGKTVADTICNEFLRGLAVSKVTQSTLSKLTCYPDSCSNALQLRSLAVMRHDLGHQTHKATVTFGHNFNPSRVAYFTDSYVAV